MNKNGTIRRKRKTPTVGGMKRSGTNAAWTKLSPKQIQQLKDWLFVEKLTYEETFEKARTELGFKGSLSSLKRFYYRTSGEVMLEEFLYAAETAQEISEASGDIADVRAASLKLLGLMLQQKILMEPEKAKE